MKDHTEEMECGHDKAACRFCEHWLADTAFDPFTGTVKKCHCGTCTLPPAQHLLDDHSCSRFKERETE